MIGWKALMAKYFTADFFLTRFAPDVPNSAINEILLETESLSKELQKSIDSTKADSEESLDSSEPIDSPNPEDASDQLDESVQSLADHRYGSIKQPFFYPNAIEQEVVQEGYIFVFQTNDSVSTASKHYENLINRNNWQSDASIDELGSSSFYINVYDLFTAIV